MSPSSLYRQFVEQPSWMGKVSVTIYGFVIIVGGLSTVFSVLAPLTSGDCLSATFEVDATPDQVLWYKSMARMTGLFGTLFLMALYVMEHSTVSCAFLLAFGTANWVQFFFIMPADWRAMGGSDAAHECLVETRMPVFFFMLLEAVGVILSILEDRAKEEWPTTSSTPPEASPLLSAS